MRYDNCPVSFTMYDEFDDTMCSAKDIASNICASIQSPMVFVLGHRSAVHSRKSFMNHVFLPTSSVHGSTTLCSLVSYTRCYSS